MENAILIIKKYWAFSLKEETKIRGSFFFFNLAGSGRRCNPIIIFGLIN